MREHRAFTPRTKTRETNAIIHHNICLYDDANNIPIQKLFLDNE